MTTETKESSFVRIKRFVTNKYTTNVPLVVMFRSIKKYAVAFMTFIKNVIQKMWRVVIKPTLAFIAEWFGPLLRGVMQGYVALCIMSATMALLSPVPVAGRFQGIPMFWALLKGYRPSTR